MSTPELTAREKAERSVKQGKMFIRQTRAKMQQLVDDFAVGKLNREQFHTLYDRYQSQINGVKLILMENDPTMWSDALDTQETLAIRKRLLAKATGMVIYLNMTGTLLDTLGKFEVDAETISKLISKLSQKVNKEGQPKLEDPTSTRYRSMSVEVPEKGWVFMAKGPLITILTSFNKEPTNDQQDTMLNLMRDFEIANASMLAKDNVTIDDLAQPFTVFVKRAR